MKTKNLFGIVLSLLLACGWAGCTENRPRANGWYHILSGQEDSIAREPIITIDDIAALRLDSDAFGRNVITGQISKHKIARWTEETEKAIGKQIAFVFNDSIICQPKVNMRIEIGAFQISSFADDRLPAIYEALMKEME